MATPEELTSAGLSLVDNDACTGSAVDLGATVTGWKPRGDAEVLFLSRDALVGEGDEIHGGVPICAPWFGHGRDDVDVPRPHGLARWVPWRLAQEDIEEHATTLVWELSGEETAHLPGAHNYPSDIWFRHTARYAETLTLTLTIGSPSTPFVLDQALHTYFAVSGIGDVEILGLESFRYRDYTAGAVWRDAEPELRISGHTDRIYDGIGTLIIRDASRSLTLRTTGAANIVVWNPGPAGAESLTGWAADEWEKMVCVEVGTVQHNAITVPAGGSHTLTLEISSERLPDHLPSSSASAPIVVDGP